MRIMKSIYLAVTCCVGGCGGPKVPCMFQSDIIYFNGEYFSALSRKEMQTYEALEDYLYWSWKYYVGKENGVLIHLVLRQEGMKVEQEYLQDERIQKLLKLEEVEPWLKIKLYYPPDYPRGACRE